MDKPPHLFRPFFELVSNPNNKSNKFAVCICCIEEYTHNIAITKKECCIINKVKSCYDHLAKCENFKKRYSESEYTEILTLNSNDGNKVIAGKRKEIEGVPCENEVNEVENNKRVKATTTQALRQAHLTNYISRPLSTQDIPHFRQLFFNMKFRFCIPAVKLPSAKALSGSVLKATSKNLVDSIIITAQNDLNGVTAAFDSWSNIRSEHLFGVVFITSEGKSLTWGAKDINSECSKTSNVISYIKDIMEQAHQHQINIKYFVSDSA
ncbi:hypothetical protein C1646_669814 [Rhizophagus diaphanus]|nr:hypothetical protein C1646_669814 [Rhizophagus diaphanus] [Rhizophagus sp. MUCL 43196]